MTVTISYTAFLLTLATGVGIATLVYFIVVLVRVNRTVARLDTTIDRADDLLVSLKTLTEEAASTVVAARHLIEEGTSVATDIAAISAHDRRDRLATVRAPTLAICARDDMVTPLYFTEELVRLIAGARAYVLPDGGHLYPNVHGAEFRRVMTSFLLES